MTVRIGEFIRCIGRRICCETISWNENYIFGRCNRADCGTNGRMDHVWQPASGSEDYPKAG